MNEFLIIINDQYDMDLCERYLLKAKRYLPRSCKCESLICGMYPFFIRNKSINVIVAIDVTSIPENIYQPNMVLNQCASIESNQSQLMVDEVTANTTTNMAEYIRLLLKFSRPGSKSPFIDSAELITEAVWFQS